MIEPKMSKIERIYCDAAMKVIDIEEDRSPEVANKVSQYVYNKYGHNAAVDTQSQNALCYALDYFFYDN